MKTQIKSFTLGACLTLALLGAYALAVNIPNLFEAGDVIRASKMNANFAALKTSVDTLETSSSALKTSVDELKARPVPPKVSIAPVDDRFAVIYENGQGTQRISVRPDGTVFAQTDPNTTVTKPAVGKYCIFVSSGVAFGTVASLENSGGNPSFNTIRVSTTVTTSCGERSFAVEIFGLVVQ